MEEPQVQSAVRLPTPDSEETPPPVATKRKRPSYSRSPSPPRRKPMLKDVDQNRAAERERQLEERLRAQPKEDASKPLTAEQKLEAAKKEYQRLTDARSGGIFVPPHRLRLLREQIGEDKQSKEWQRMAWEALKRSINGMINKVNTANIKFIVPEMFTENLIRGRGLFCRSIMKAQAASLPFTPIYAAMVAVVNSKLPQIGELLISRLVVQFRKAFKRNDKAVCLSSTTFIAHLVNQQVVSEMLAAQILLILLQNPTDDSVEIAVGLMREVGQHIEEMNSQIANLVFDQFRSILQSADIDRRAMYQIEVLFQVRKDKYRDNAAIKEELDLVEEEDQISHQCPNIDGPIDVQDGLNIFKYDAEWEEHEDAYKTLRQEILGEGDRSDEDDDDASSEDSSDEEQAEEKAMEIQDQTNTDLTNLRRTIYLTLTSSADFEEAVHKLMKLNLPVGREDELPSMIIESCSQRPTYEKFYGSIGDRLARLNRLWTEQFEAQFAKYYETIHRYETNRLRNIARFFGHIISTEAIGMHVFSVVQLNEDDTTSSSRIFLKICIQDIAEAIGMKALQARLRDPVLAPSLTGIFPTDNPRNTRFSINYFTSIGMGAITEDLREYLKNMPKPAVPALPAAPANDDSDSDSASSYSSYSSYSSSSRSPTPQPRSSRRSRRTPSVSRSRTPPRRTTARQRSPSRSASPDRRAPRARRRSYSRSLSRDRKSSERSSSKSPAPQRERPRERERERERTPTRRAPPKERSLSPYSKRVALTRGPGAAAGPSGSRGGRAKAGDYM